MEQRQVSDSARPVGVGELLDNTFRQYRTHFRFWFLISACILVPYMVLNSIFSYQSENELKSFLTAFGNQLSQGSGASNPFQALQSVQAQQPHALYMVWLLALLQLFVVTPLLYGALVHFVTELQLFQRTVTIDEAFFKSVKRLFAVIVTMIVLVILAVIAFFVLSMVSGLIGVVGYATGNVVVYSVLIFLIVIGFTVAVFWFLIRMAFVPSAVIEERKIFFSAIARSWVLTRRKFWRSFGFLALVYLIVIVLQVGVDVVITLLVNNNVVSIILTNLVSLFMTPLWLLGIANLYTDLRVRTDSPDLHRWLGGEGQNGAANRE